MKTEINPPTASKINLTAFITALLNILVYVAVHRDWIPQDAVVDVLVMGNMLAAALVGVFRTWFTDPS